MSGVAVRGDRGRRAERLYILRRGSESRAAVQLAVTWKRLIRGVECRARTVEVPWHNDPAIRGGNDGIEVFSGSCPVILGGIDGTPREAALQRKNTADRPAFKRLPFC